MARLKDVPLVLRSVGFFPFLKRVWNEVLDDHLLIFAAALAYAWLFAIFPFLIFLLHLMYYLPGGREQTLGDVKEFLEYSLPNLAARMIGEYVSFQAKKPHGGGVMSLSL